MDSLTTNDEQAVLGAADDAIDPVALAEADPGDLVVSNGREFFQEADEVRASLQRIVRPDLDTRDCREACERVGAIWSQYQEQPGLLDPFLEEMVTPLIGAISAAVHENTKAPLSVFPNLHLLTSLLYILTTVRGYKTVSRLFPHEAADLEPCLEVAEAEAAAKKSETWSTLYCLTLWLGMVLLTPFDLESIDSGGQKGLSHRVFDLGLAGLRSTSRTRDASAWMLAKYFTRPDVTVAGSLQTFFKWTRDAWVSDDAGVTGLVFTRSGALQAWNQTLKSAPRTVLKTIWTQLLELTIQGPAGRGDVDFKASSALRKLRVAVACRAGLVALPPRLAPWRYDRGARSLLVNFSKATGGESAQMFCGNVANSFAPPARAAAAGRAGDADAPEEAQEEEEEEDIPEQVEEVIELLLASISDSDTVVRWASAKGIGRITNRLSRDFGDQVLESLLERCFSFRETDKAWHGGCLALAELTRRGLLLPERLPTVVPLICQALHFEQVSGNHAVGQHVRDAACYVCWAFARAYAPDVLEPFVADLASALLQVALYDREINCRRAAAAAVQEHVGRQGTFPNGIDVITVADYWTLSARRHAYLEVAPQVAALGGGEGTYRQDLIDHLVNRKLTHQDLQIRLLAGSALARLVQQPSARLANHINEVVLPSLLATALATEASATAGASRATAGGPTTGTVQSRHGAVVGVAALVEVAHAHIAANNQGSIRNLVPSLEKIRAYRGRGGEVIRQAACALLARIAGAESWSFKEATSARYLQTVGECARHTTDGIQVAAADALGCLASRRFTAELCDTCITNYVSGLAKADETIAARRGFVLCLGSLPAAALQAREAEVLATLCREVRGVGLPGGQDQDDPQTRQYAALSLGRLCLGVPVKGEALDAAVEALKAAMADYATDRRGDVGSWVREAAMEVIAALLEAQSAGVGPTLPDPEASTSLVALLLQQAVEKIDRLRERAFGLLLRLLCKGPKDPPARFLELAYRRVCHGESYHPVPTGQASLAGIEAKRQPRQAWPPADFERLAAALHGARPLGDLPGADGAASADAATFDRIQADRSAAVFDALVPLLACDAYRPSLSLGLVVSMGGITEYTAKGAKRALLQYMQDSAGQGADEVSRALMAVFDRAGDKDGDAEAKRLLAPLFATLGILLAQDCWPGALAPVLLDRVLAAVRRSRDIGRLRASIAVFVGLLRWPGSVRHGAITTLLQFLGYSFPTIRQTTAQSLYIRLLEEADGMDLSADGAGPEVPSSALEEVQEIMSVTPWGTDNEEALAAALRQVYEKLALDLPTSGRSILAPKKPRERQEAKEAGYADLVRENHY